MSNIKTYFKETRETREPRELSKLSWYSICFGFVADAELKGNALKSQYFLCSSLFLGMKTEEVFYVFTSNVVTILFIFKETSL